MSEVNHVILHIPEGIVPFEDSFCGRKPLYPFAGEPVALSCRCDAGTPVLETDGADLRGISPEKISDGAFRFTLPRFPAARTLRYRFTCGDEATPWYTLDVLARLRVTEPLAVSGSAVQLGEGIFWTFSAAQGIFSLALTGAADASPLPVCGAFRLCPGEGGLFSLKKDGRTVLSCRSVTLGLRADGTVAHQELQLEGTHRHIFGTGERFDRVDQMGRGSCGQVTEHFTRQGAWTYLPVPMFLTDAGFGYFRKTGCSVRMDLGSTIRLSCPCIPGQRDFLLTGTPKTQLSSCLRLSGTPALPPEWVFGLWISANGWSSDADVDEQLQALKSHHCPASVMVLEAWSDESTFYRWSDLWGNPSDMVRRVREAGLHLVLWQIPVLKALRDCPDRTHVDHDLHEALEKGYLVRRADGSTYVVPERWFQGSVLPDFTSPEACAWWFSRRDHLLEAGVEGFKCDGGEFLFGSDIALSDGTPGEEAHNLYPLIYERAYHEWMASRGLPAVTFSRAGYAGAQRYPLHWAGDQLSTWEELRGQLSAGLSAGLSGIFFWGFDIGGFAGELPEAELYLRATALGCFSPVMQWHAEPRSGQFYQTHSASFVNDRSPWNLARQLKRQDVLETAVAFARLREKLRPYIWQEAQACVQLTRPLMAHLCIDFPEDDRALSCPDEYMFGRRYLVAPVTEKGAEGRNVYLPEGEWKHFFTGEHVQGPGQVYIPCPLDQIPVFERIESAPGG